MSKPVSRLYSNGSLSIANTGYLDEVTFNINRQYGNGTIFVANTGQFDEVTLNPIASGVARKILSDGTYQIAGVFNEYDETLQYSALFDGSSYMYAAGAAPTGAAIGTADFTVEGWFYLTSSPSTFKAAVYTGDATTTGPSIAFRDNQVKYVKGNTIALAGSTSTLTTNVWYHVAICRISGVVKMFLNGVQDAADFPDTTNFGTPPTNYPQVGWSPVNSGFNFSGYISNVRVVVGVGVYTGNFTPSIYQLDTIQQSGTNIAALTDPANTKFFACRSATFTDDSIYARTITRVGTISVSNSIPFS